MYSSGLNFERNVFIRADIAKILFILVSSIANSDIFTGVMIILYFLKRRLTKLQIDTFL